MRQLTIKDAIAAHLYPTWPRLGVQYKSSLIAVLTDARGATGRDPDTGSVVSPDHTRSWLGATGYLILLDQVGTCFRQAGVNVVTDNPIAPALKQFSHVTDDARVDVIYALRHALAHDYALFNANSKHPSRQHAFNFTADDDTPLVVLPRRAWNGSYNASTSIAPEETTVVNLRALGDLCEEVVANLRQLHERQRLGITMIAANRIKPTVHPLVSRAARDPDDEYDSLVIWQIPPLLCGRPRRPAATDVRTIAPSRRADITPFG